MNYATETAFAHDVVGGRDMYERALEWFRTNASPEDVFGYETIIDWVREHAVQDDAVLKSVGEQNLPDDVFPADELDNWALRNGYSKTT